MAIINTGSISKALMPGVNAWYGASYNEHPTEYTDIFKTYSSDKKFEEDVNLYGLGLAPVKDEAGVTTYDAFGQGFITRYVHAAYSLGFIITREMIADNQYTDVAEKRSKFLGQSMRQTKEVVAANILNRAFNSSYVYGDGIELISTVNLLSKGGTFSNKLAVAADLSEMSLEQMCIDIMGAVNDASLNMQIMPEKLIIPRQCAFDAERILKSTLQSNSANNSLNALRSKNMLPGGYAVNHYLTDSDAFFVITNAPDGLKHFSREAAEMSNDTDFDSDNLKFKAYERYSFGCSDKRAIFGTPGA